MWQDLRAQGDELALNSIQICVVHSLVAAVYLVVRYEVLLGSKLNQVRSILLNSNVCTRFKKNALINSPVCILAVFCNRIALHRVVTLYRGLRSR